MKLMNYMNLNRHPAQFSFQLDRTREFVEVFHAHQGMELLYVHEGYGTVIVEQQIIELRPGILFFFKPFQLHRIRVHDLPNKTYIRSLFVFEPAVLDASLASFPSLRAFFTKLWKGALTEQCFTKLSQEAMLQLFQVHRPILANASQEERLEEQLLFLTALLHQLKATAGPLTDLPGAPSKPSYTAERIMEWIESHYMEPFELKRLAHAIHLSPNHVSAVFKMTVGSSITEYLTARRIRQACWLLKTTDAPVQEIGQLVGLSNFSYFCQMFKKHVGLTPHQFKRSPQA